MPIRFNVPVAKVIDQEAVRLASIRHGRRVLAGFAGWGWLAVVLVAGFLQHYSGDDAAGPLTIALFAVWALSVVAWVVLVLLDRRSHPDGRTSMRAERLVAAARPVPWFRLTVCAVLAVALPWVLQDLAAAGAGALQVGRQVTYTAEYDASGGRGTVVSHGVWTDGGLEHPAALMDGTPSQGDEVTVRKPPLGGDQVYSGGFFSWFAVVVLLAVLAAFALLLRSTHRAMVASRRWTSGTPPWQRRGNRSGDDSWRGLDHQVQVRPHPGTNRKGEQRRPSVYDRNVSLAASGTRFVIVDRKGEPHEFPRARPGTHPEYAVAELAWVTYVHHDGRTGDMTMHALYVLDGWRSLVARVDADDWDLDELAKFAVDAGLAFSRPEFASDEALAAMFPMLPGTLDVSSINVAATFLLVVVLPVTVLFCLFLGLATR